MDGSIGEGLSNLGQFMTSPQMPVLAGQLGAAAMGPNQNTWQSMVGKVAADYGRSAIAAGEAKAQADKAQMFWKQILPAVMAGYSPTDTTGINKITVGNDGKAKIDLDVANAGGNAPAGGQAGTPNTGQAVSPAPQQPIQSPGFNPRMLPF